MEIEVKLRDRMLDDAERFWHILNNENFRWFGKPPDTIEGERAYIEKDLNNPLMRNYTILYGEEIVGGIGIRMDAHRSWIAEVGYFIDENHWNKGIATRAVLLCKEKAKELGIRRIELVIDKENTASEYVAIKAGYGLDGLMLRKLKNPRDGTYADGLLYSKLID